MSSDTEQRDELIAGLRLERDRLVTDLFVKFGRIERKLNGAFEERAAGNHPEARILLNEALDIEHAATGDCEILGGLSEDWGVDYERDQRADPEDS